MQKAIFAVSLWMGIAQAGIITDGNATYNTGTAPTSETSTAPSVDFRPDGTTDHLFGNWWYYRVAGDTRERPVGNYAIGGGSISASEVAAGNTSTFTVTESDAGGTRFTGTLVFVLTDGAAPGLATLSMTLTLSNPSLSPLSMSLFNYIDADVNGTAGTDTASLASSSSIQISDGATFYHSAVSPTAYQVAAFASIRALLLDANVNNLNNTGLPFGPADYTGAWQWDVVIPAGGSVVLQSSFTSDAPGGVPEPSTYAMAGLGLALLGASRSRVFSRQV